MVKRVNPAFILAKIESECDKVFFSATEDTVYATAVTNALGTLTLTGTDFNVAGGDAGGDSEKISLIQKAITWDVSGTVAYANFFKSTGTEHVVSTTAVTNKAVNATDSGTINAFDVWEIGAAT